MLLLCGSVLFALTPLASLGHRAAHTIQKIEQNGAIHPYSVYLPSPYMRSVHLLRMAGR